MAIGCCELQVDGRRLSANEIKYILDNFDLSKEQIQLFRKCLKQSAQSRSGASLSGEELDECRLPERRLTREQAFTPQTSKQQQLAALKQQFRDYSGASLEFERSGLPQGNYFDRLPGLSLDRQIQAAEIALREVKKYPPKYLEQIGLGALGVFDACVSNSNDGYHRYSREHQGYLYYGVWNGENAIAGAYYTDEQLPLTIHHEIFHHVDGTRNGNTNYRAYFEEDDAQFTEAVSGRARYRAPSISRDDYQALKSRSGGAVLTDAMGAYTEKSRGEDQAETARYMMSHLPDALLQTIERPHLPGSQRILHVIREYERSHPNAPGFDWFVDLALGRTATRSSSPDVASPSRSPEIISASLKQYGALDEWTQEQSEVVRGLLDTVAKLDAGSLSGRQGEELVSVAADLTYKLTQRRIQPSAASDSYVIWGREQSPGGVNTTLQQDVLRAAEDAQRLQRICRLVPGQQGRMDKTGAQLFALVENYRSFIDSRFSLSGATADVFERAKAGIRETMSTAPVERPSRPARRVSSRVWNNRYISKVDEAIEFDPRYADYERRVEQNIRKVQPATVLVNGASGVNVSSSGKILTNAHVADAVGNRMYVQFPDGKKYVGRCTSIDNRRDLAIVELEGSPGGLPYAPVAQTKPAAGTGVVLIGQPGGYDRWHVSTGKIQENKRTHPWHGLGGVAHTAWTYWGNSGSPLFNYDGEIVALHNTWDSSTALRHAVPLDEIQGFLRESGVSS